VILAYYTLNDIILGTVVEDEEVGKERNELMTVLDDLSKVTGLKINVDAVKDVVNKLGVEKERESVIEESRAVFVQQLKDLVTA
jgi:phenylalanyl-tRNA synthetase beta subunit